MKTTEITKLFNTSGERLRQMAQEGHFEKPIRGEWKLEAVAAGLVAYLQSRLKMRRESPEFILARQTKMETESKLAALALEEKQNKIVSREAVEKVWAARKLAIRDIVLRAPLPKKIQEEMLSELENIKTEDYLDKV